MSKKNKTLNKLISKNLIDVKPDTWYKIQYFTKSNKKGELSLPYTNPNFSMTNLMVIEAEDKPVQQIVFQAPLDPAQAIDPSKQKKEEPTA